MDDDDCAGAELVTFRSTRGTYVYAPIPSATSYGHRAELWDVDKWLKEVKTCVVSAGDGLIVRMEDLLTGELFAECPLPSDGTPLITAVEPVVDSSRYFVLRVADRDTKKHAFVGLGFRERAESSDFAAALDEYRLYLRRKREAMQNREAFEKQQQEGTPPEGAAAGAPCSPASSSNYALQGSITLKIGGLKPKQDTPSGFLARAVSFPLNKQDTVGVPKLQPPAAARPEGASQRSGAALQDPSQCSSALVVEVMRRLSLGGEPHEAGCSFNFQPFGMGEEACSSQPAAAGSEQPLCSAQSLQQHIIGGVHGQGQAPLGEVDDIWGDFVG